jgi:hypothetical protein
VFSGFWCHFSARQLALSKLVSFWQRFLGHYQSTKAIPSTKHVFRLRNHYMKYSDMSQSPYTNLRSLCSQCNSTPLKGTSSSFRCTTVLRNARDPRGLRYLVACTEFGIAISAIHRTISRFLPRNFRDTSSCFHSHVS